MKDKIRKIAANCVFLPETCLVKNGYIEMSAFREISVVDTGGQIKDLAGLEFYGGLLVPGYVCEYQTAFEAGMKLLPFLERLFVKRGKAYERVAIIEGADLIRLEWTAKATIRLL